MEKNGNAGLSLMPYNRNSITVSDPDILKSPVSLRHFRRHLLDWYRSNRRALPWRKTRDPYRIWISEIMLQQTRVAAVLEHYKLFLKRFPTVQHLAAASEAEVLAAWSGLGYYRRARMLHAAAKLVAGTRTVRLPRSSAELRELPGIGRYTANAVASIAFNEPVAVVDGNVERVLSRTLRKALIGDQFWSTAQMLLDSKFPGDFNQAMMELGAVICVPGVPVCTRCPVKRQCASRGAEPKNSGSPELRQRRSASLLLLRRGQRILLQRRSPHESLMPDMWELPQSVRDIGRKPLLVVKHSITTTDWTVRVFAGGRANIRDDMRWVALSDVAQLPLTGVTRKVLRKLSLLA